MREPKVQLMPRDASLGAMRECRRALGGCAARYREPVHGGRAVVGQGELARSMVFRRQGQRQIRRFAQGDLDRRGAGPKLEREAIDRGRELGVREGTRPDVAGVDRENGGDGLHRGRDFAAAAAAAAAALVDRRFGVRSIGRAAARREQEGEGNPVSCTHGANGTPPFQTRRGRRHAGGSEPTSSPRTMRLDGDDFCS